jgi:hypothetical protein
MTDTVFGDDEEPKTAQRKWPLRRDYSKVELWGFEPQTSSMPWTTVPSARVALGRVSAVQGGSAV